MSPSRSHQPHDGARAFVFAASSACSDWRTKPGLDASLDRTSGLVRSISPRRSRRRWDLRKSQSRQLGTPSCTAVNRW